MKQVQIIGIVLCMLMLTAGMALAQGEIQGRPDIPMSQYGYGPYGYSASPYAPGLQSVPRRPWNPRMNYDPGTGLWYPPGGGVGRRYSRSAVEIFDPWLGGTVHVPRDVYESGVWEETPNFRFERYRP
jgi:hypothetical protein